MASGKTLELSRRDQIAEFKKRTAEYRKCAMTVLELRDRLNEFIEKGDGDAMVDVSDNCGGSYHLSRNCTTFRIEDCDFEVFGKWLKIE